MNFVHGDLFEARFLKGSQKSNRTFRHPRNIPRWPIGKYMMYGTFQEMAQSGYFFQNFSLTFIDHFQLIFHIQFKIMTHSVWK
jgi:hypothetical protein